MGDKKYDLCKGAINAIESCAKLYKVTFHITVSKFTGNWKINVMGKVFHNNDFLKSANAAIAFIYNAHNQKEDKQ